MTRRGGSRALFLEGGGIKSCFLTYTFYIVIFIKKKPKISLAHGFVIAVMQWSHFVNEMSA